MQHVWHPIVTPSLCKTSIYIMLSIIPLPDVELSTWYKYDCLGLLRTCDLIKPCTSKRTKFTTSKTWTKWLPISFDTNSASTYFSIIWSSIYLSSHSFISFSIFSGLQQAMKKDLKAFALIPAEIVPCDPRQ